MCLYKTTALRTLSHCNEESPDVLCPEDAEAFMQCRVQHCHQYHKLLCQHLKQHEELEAGKWTEGKCDQAAEKNQSGQIKAGKANAQ